MRPFFDRWIRLLLFVWFFFSFLFQTLNVLSFDFCGRSETMLMPSIAHPWKRGRNEERWKSRRSGVVGSVSCFNIKDQHDPHLYLSPGISSRNLGVQILGKGVDYQIIIIFINIPTNQTYTLINKYEQKYCNFQNWKETQLVKIMKPFLPISAKCAKKCAHFWVTYFLIFVASHYHTYNRIFSEASMTSPLPNQFGLSRFVVTLFT